MLKYPRSPCCTALPALAMGLTACATSGRATQDSGEGFADTGSDGGNTSGSLPNGAGGDDSSGPILITLEDGEADAGRPPKCDDAGHCSCMNIASIGKPGHYGAGNDNTDAFTGWLNTQSSASVDMYMTKPMITPAFLANYDVLIIQWLTDSNSGPYWTFAASEVTALKAWVDAGGGLVTLSGYDSSSQEVTPLNQILSFTDISYNMDDVLGACNGNSLCYCWGNSVPLSGWGATVIGQNITQVGAFHGHSINAASATVDCPNPGSTTAFAVHETVGSGHVVAFADEWVTYTSQWLGTSSATTGTMFTDPNNPCYQKSAAQVFQVPQFWYNVLKFAASATHCKFTIMEPSIIQ
jgi:hypothetical protein